MTTNKNFKEKVKETTQKFETSVIATYSNPTRMKGWLKNQLHFKKYSPMNRMLIYSQNPDASYVQSYTAWKSMGHPPKGAGTGIKILAPRMCKMLELPDGTQVIASKATKEQKASAVKEFTKQYGFNICYVYDISATDANEADLLKKAGKSWDDAKEVYKALTEYTGIEKTENLVDLIHQYTSERLLNEYGDFDLLPMLIDADTYCILSNFNLDTEMVDFESFNNKSFSEEDVQSVRKLNDAICKSSILLIEELSQALA